MKLSFSTKGWYGQSFSEYLDMAKEYGFSGIEIYDVEDKALSEDDGPFRAGSAAPVLRDMMDRGLRLTCLNSLTSITDKTAANKCREEISRLIKMASRLKIPHIQIHSSGEPEAPEFVDDIAAALIESVLPEAEAANICLLVETCGIYADTARLRNLLNRFACDHVAALWDMHYPYRVCNEEPSVTIGNLGAYVRHVHLKDSDAEDGEVIYCLTGDGTLPIGRMMDSLRSVNYDGYVSLEWDPAWYPELGDPDIIFPQFAGYMSRFYNLSRASRALFFNNAGTGRYIWKKDAILDMNFPEMLDRVVEEFPDQYAVKFTTLDYTRTYAEFREDVNECARSLMALGVKPGDKVAVWMTNLPQWYVTFWASVKIGAVLVTVNTAYKIHEAEHLLKQSDTHTLVLERGYRDSDYAGIVAKLCPEIDGAKRGEPLHCRRLPFIRNIITVGFRMGGCLT